MKHIIEEEVCDSIEEDMFFPDITHNKTNNNTYYPGKKCAYSDKKGKCILGDEYKKCIHKKSDDTCDYIYYREQIPITDFSNYKIESYEKSEKVDINCYLTSACMRYYLTNFDDNCYELTVLRWFRDNFVSKEDIKYYYNTAPQIVEAIEQEEKKDIIYNYIYDNVVDACVEAIENGNYEFAYTRYKESILSLEQTFLKPTLQSKLIRTLKQPQKKSLET